MIVSKKPVRRSVLSIATVLAPSFLLPQPTFAGKPAVVRFHNKARESNFKVSWVQEKKVSWRAPQEKIHFMGTASPGAFHSINTQEGHTFQIELQHDDAFESGTSKARRAQVARVTVAADASEGDVDCWLKSTLEASATSTQQASMVESWFCKPEWKNATAAGQAAELYSGPLWERTVAEEQRKCAKKLEREPEDKRHFCDSVVHAKYGPTQCAFQYRKPGEFEKRLAVAREKFERTMRTQTQGLQIFTDEGFTVYQGGLAALDPSLLRDIREFWLENRLKAWAAKHDHFDPAVPACKTDIWKTEMPTSLQKRLEAAVRPPLAEWIGLPAEDLVPTSTHGVRLYREGSWLGMHLDKRDTHAVSVILELGHLAYGYPADFYDLTDAELSKKVHDGSAPGYDYQWPLEFVDHDNVTHFVANRAGQLLFYESATVFHGRPTPFPGREFANVFIHFAPKGWPEEYEVRPGAGEDAKLVHGTVGRRIDL